MRIVIDLQGAQTESRRCGIGRHCLSLAMAIVRESLDDHEVLIALNGSLPESIEPIRAAFYGLLPQENIRVWHSPGPVSEVAPHDDIRRHAAELLREAFLASLQPDIVHVSSIFEGWADDAATSVGAFASTLPTAVTLYGPTAYVYHDTDLAQPNVEQWYDSKINHLRRADLLLVMSESTRHEVIDNLGLPSDSVVNISVAAKNCFQPLRLDAESVASIWANYALARPFVMCSAGIDLRNDLETFFQAYAGLPQSLRQTHQLAIVCARPSRSKPDLENLAEVCGLGREEVVLVFPASESDLVALYNLCRLFVIPAWHDGINLQALEAMRCGSAVIVADIFDLPEIVGCEDALFDPISAESIRSKMLCALTDEEYRKNLSCHGVQLTDKYSWKISAQRAIKGFERVCSTQTSGKVFSPSVLRRPTLAYISPLPPQRSGIAHYSAELLPGLARHYQIIAITKGGQTSDPWVNANCQIRTPEWLERHAHEVDRVLYHFGNSEFHEFMFELVERVPGIAVLHDFFLSSVQASKEGHGPYPYAWTWELYHSHGYKAIRDRYLVADSAEVVWRYPANLSVLQWAQGIIVHSESSRRLAVDWYGSAAPCNWRVIPLLRTPSGPTDKRAARSLLGLSEDSFVVCSFGLLGPSKLNHRLLSAWEASSLASDSRCVLIFVGENHPGEYGQRLQQQIRACVARDRIRITGWADVDMFRHYLDAADVGVQLRTSSRGETSAAVLDCLNHGLATIVNANGSMADIREECVWMLPDAFTDHDLVTALHTLAEDTTTRNRLSMSGRTLIQECHSPQHCVEQYHAAIESFWASGRHGVAGLYDALSEDEFALLQEGEIQSISTAIAGNICPIGPNQLFVDISVLVQLDGKTGIQRVVKSILRELIESPPTGFRVEPVFARQGTSGYFYARRFTSRFVGGDDSWAFDDPIDACVGDIFLGLDWQPVIVPQQTHYLNSLRDRGVAIHFVVYDLLPIIHPQFFLSEVAFGYTKWLNTIIQYDKVITISKAVANELVEWLAHNGSMRLRPLQIDWFHLGADINYAKPARNETTLQRQLNKLSVTPTFLIVGTLEPRKGHALVLDAFEQLWAEGADINLVIVGKSGWLVDDLLTRLSTHKEKGKHLFWEGQIDDQRLEKFYKTSDCLIAASAAEGFGLPLIEAAMHGLAIIARDIPVFREVAGDCAFYFDAHDASELAQSIRAWLAFYSQAQHPRSDDMSWLTWAQSARYLEQAIFRQQNYANWMPANIVRTLSEGESKATEG